MLTPYRTLADPEVQGEGSLDPLGLSNAADRLADWILPGMTARMWRPRFLTAIAVCSLVVEPFAEELAADQVSPPWLVTEWHYVEAMAAVRDGQEDLRRVPGIDKARQALRDGVPMNADRYLKTPKVFGFHGVYKRLARHVDIVDDHLALGDAGFRLLRVWEAEQDLQGFADRERVEGDAIRLRKTLRDAVREGLQAGHTVRRGQWPGAGFFTEHLMPHRIGRGEGQVIWDLLASRDVDTRREIFHFLRERGPRRQLATQESERRVFDALRQTASRELRSRMEAIEAYEAFCRPVQESWDRLRYLSTVRGAALVRPEDLARDPRSAEIAGLLRPAIERAREALAISPVAAEFEDLVHQFGDVGSGPELFARLWERHRDVQRAKPPEGKRPWFDEVADGGLIVRPPYRLEGAPVREEFVHPYRLFAVASFNDDLWGAA